MFWYVGFSSGDGEVWELSVFTSGKEMELKGRAGIEFGLLFNSALGTFFSFEPQFFHFFSGNDDFYPCVTPEVKIMYGKWFGKNT